MPMLILKTENYYLKNLNVNDATERYLSWLHDLEVTKTLEVDGQSQTIETIKDYIKWHDGKTKFLFGIYANNDKHIGNFSVRINVDHRRATIGLMIGDKYYWGKNAVNETRSKIIDWLFDEKGINKIESGPMSNNYPAIFNFTKQGWQNEGILKEHYLIDGKKVDSVLYGITKTEWKKLKDKI